MSKQSYLSIYAKSFNWAGFFLPKKTYLKCSALYDFCRVVDNIADDESSIEFKKKKFELFEKNFNQKNLLLEVVAFGVWLTLYLSLLGPLINKLFWPFNELYFSFKFGPVFILIIGYFVIRIVINVVMRKNVFYSK